MKNKNTNTKSVIMILLAGFGWGNIGVFSRPLTAAGLDAVQITFVRSSIVLIGMGIFLLLKDRSLFRIAWKDLWMFLGSGIISIVFFNICYFLTIEQATLAAASVLLYTAPCFVLLMSAVFFHEKITVQKLIALVLAFGGCVLVSGFTGGQMSGLAVLTGICSGIGYATYSIFGTVAMRKYHFFTFIFYTFVFACAMLFPFSAVPETVAILAGSPTVLALGIGLGVASTLLPYIFYTGGLRNMEAGKASVLAFAEPLVATVAGILIFKEQLHLQNALGILLIFLAILLLNIPLELLNKKEKSGEKTA